jgi:hypothetical protein
MSKENCFPAFKARMKNKRLTGVRFFHSWIILFIELDKDTSDDFTIYSRITIERDKRECSTDEAGFRDKLCELIGETIAEISSNETHFTFLFKNKTKLKFALSMPGETYPEVAITMIEGQYVVFFNEGNSI